MKICDLIKELEKFVPNIEVYHSADIIGTGFDKYKKKRLQLAIMKKHKGFDIMDGEYLVKEYLPSESKINHKNIGLIL